MSVLNRPLFRRGFANGGFAELRDRPVRELFSGIAGLQAAPDDFARGPMVPEALRQTEQMLSDPRVARGGQNFDAQLRALQGMTNQELLRAADKGFDPALVQRAIEDRGGRMSPAGRAIQGIASLGEGVARRISPLRPGEDGGLEVNLESPLGSAVERFYLQPAMRGYRHLVTPQFPGEGPTFMEALRGSREEEGSRPAVDPAAAVREQRGEAGAGQADVPFVTIESEDDVPVVDADGRVSTPRPEAGGAAAPAAPRDDLLDAYESRSSLYDEVLGSSEERRQQARSRIMFDIAQRALAFAGGVTPEGQRTSGSVVSQAAQAFAGAPGVVAEESRSLQDQERAMRLAQLQQAEKEVGERAAGDQDFARRLTLLRAQAMLDRETFTPLDYDAVKSQEPEELSGWEREVDLRAGFGSGAVLRNWLNNAVGVFGGKPPAEETDKAVSEIKNFNNGLLNTLGRDISDTGRLSNLVIEFAREVMPGPTEFTTNPYKAVNSYEAISKRIDSVVDSTRREYNAPGTTQKRRDELRPEYFAAMRGRRMLDGMLSNLKGQTPSGDSGDVEDPRVIGVRRAMEEG